MKDGGRQNELD